MVKITGAGWRSGRLGNAFVLAIEIPFIVKSTDSLTPSIAGWLLAGCFFCFCASTQAAAPVPVRTQTLAESVIYPESAAPAIVVSLNDAPIAAQLDALVVEVPVRVGDTVKAGAVLVKLACKDFELEQSRLKAERQAIQARLELAQWQLKQAETLAAQQTLPEEQVQEKRSQLAVLRSDLAAHGARIEITDRQISHCTVNAPFPGVVTARLIAVGQFAARGTALVELLDMTQPEVSAQVSSRETDVLRQAKSLTFEHDGKHYPLSLRAVLPTIHTETGTQEVRLDFTELRSDPGAAGRLIWQAGMPHVPAEYLVQRGGQLGVFIIADGKAHFHALPGSQSGRPAMISLPPETQLIVTGQFGLSEGTDVKAEPLQGR
jgi:RND family efflux transporter MFP subunit